MPSQLRLDPLDVDTSGEAAVAKLNARRLDESNSEAVGERLFRLVEERGRTQLHLDMGNVESVSSTGLGKLIALNKKVRGVGGHLTLYNVDGFVYEIFQVTQLHRLLDIRAKAAG
jgi:anti-anti-sigma factor